jgi:alkylation response protein AidB-like acyl-CoA dehydrogenase
VLDLEFSSEQTMLKETLRDLLDVEAPLGVVRELEDDPVGYSPELWATLGRLDVIGLMLPESHGGSGMSLIEGVALYEELGRLVTPTPHLVSAVLSGGAIAAAGSDALKDAWLPSIASGAAIFSVAWLEPESGFGPKGVTLRAEPAEGGFTLSGVKRHVAFASSADRLVVLARTGDEERSIDLFIVDPSSAGVRLEQKMTIASDAQYDVHLDGVVVAASDRIGEAGSGWETWERVVQQSWILSGAQAVGGAKYAQEITVQYAKDRQQFDKPIGAFQALAHYMADAQTALDGAEQLVHEAAWASAAGHDITKLAPMAKLFACRTFRDLTAMAQQIFGGIGFTVEFDIQLYFRRAKALQLSWGDDRTLSDAVAAAVLD